MEKEPEVQAEVDMVQWADGTHEILIYNDNNGYGLTACEEKIGPWDVWLVGTITCVKCRRLRTEEKHKEKGPREWFPKKPGEKKGETKG